jgi:YihY family inner membrane protein
MQFPPAFLKRAIDAVDRAQQKSPITAFPIGVLKRYGDDRGGMYAALITFYALLSVFPLLLLFVTIASMILGANSAAEKRLVNSAFEHFPVVGSQLANSIHALSSNSWPAFVVSLLFLLWGALGVTSALQMASHHAWRRPRKEEPNLLIRTWRGLRLLGIIASAVVLTTVASGFISSGVLRSFPGILRVVLLVAVIAVNAGAYFLALRTLAPPEKGWKSLLPGTIVGTIGWTVLQQAGGYLLSHQLQHTSQIYGFFAIVLGLIFWLNLGAQLFLYSSEINIVAAQGGWPRSFFEPSDEVKVELANEQSEY